mmetsp:Transcript_13485/g.22518  ORF Transcript_13485/g.22518 Transcript_13485/m.22518 type:complete len:140 (+) Transcript_13485:713-1132(+)
MHLNVFIFCQKMGFILLFQNFKNRLILLSNDFELAKSRCTLHDVVKFVVVKNEHAVLQSRADFFTMNERSHIQARFAIATLCVDVKGTNNAHVFHVHVDHQSLAFLPSVTSILRAMLSSCGNVRMSCSVSWHAVATMTI